MPGTLFQVVGMKMIKAIIIITAIPMTIIYLCFTLFQALDIEYPQQPNKLIRYYLLLQFTIKENEVQRGEMVYSRSHGWVVELEFESRQSCSSSEIK